MVINGLFLGVSILNDAVMNNFNFVTPSEMIKAHPNESKKYRKYVYLSRLPDKTCINCPEKAWKMAETDLCFTCTTGEWDASDDYELLPEPNK